jgi:hypothetical protein
MLNLTEENYYSPEANLAYMSYSQYKRFLSCEARAVAELKGEWVEEKSDALLLGSYIHAAIESDEALEKFKKENPEIFSSQGATKGQLKSNFKRADDMILAAVNDRVVQVSLDGEHEKIVTGFFAGCQWKCKIDVLNRPDGYLTDFKTARSLYEKFWDEENRVYLNFIEYYGYPGQLALYSQIEMLDSGRDSRLNTLLTIVTSEEHPDKIVISFNPEQGGHPLNDYLLAIQNNMPRVLAVKNGNEKPRRCNKCDYCRSTKTLSGILDFDDFLGLHFNY